TGVQTCALPICRTFSWCRSRSDPVRPVRQALFLSAFPDRRVFGPLDSAFPDRARRLDAGALGDEPRVASDVFEHAEDEALVRIQLAPLSRKLTGQDRKSTRLNSSHVKI